MDYYNEKLEQIKKDEFQLEAYNTNDSSVVIAGPGSGKTTILTLKIMRLLKETIKEPIGLACLTFSKEAAREFKDRLYLMGFSNRKNVFLGTVHSFCINEILNNYGKLYNLGINFPIKIFPQRDKKKLFNEIIEKMNYKDKKYKVLDMDKIRNLSIKGKSKILVELDEDLIKISNEYEKRLYELGFVDYESIVKLSIYLIQEKKYVRDCLNAKFKWILIDEYQDLGKPLHEMILTLFENTNIKFFAVGDPDQSIYSFSGAYPNYLLELSDREDIKNIKLVNNYRSNQDIIDGSEMVLEQKRNYVSVNRKTEKAEYYFITCEEDLKSQYLYVVNKIIPYYLKKRIPAEEISILVSSNANAKELGLYCANNNIPYYISKHDFERSDTVKWLEDIASWLIDKATIDFNNIYSFYEKILLSQKNRGFFIEKEVIELKKKIYSILENSKKFKDIIKEWLKYIVKELKLVKLLEASDVYPDEVDNLRILYNEVKQPIYDNYTIERFSNIGKPQNQVTISTRHSCKGLEFEIVIMLGMEEGNFPSSRNFQNVEAMEEENRMCFVCISRAKSTCILLRSKINNIQCKDLRIWKKKMQPSRYWVKLENKYKKKS